MNDFVIEAQHSALLDWTPGALAHQFDDHFKANPAERRFGWPMRVDFVGYSYYLPQLAGLALVFEYLSLGQR